MPPTLHRRPDHRSRQSRGGRPPAARTTRSHAFRAAGTGQGHRPPRSSPAARLRPQTRHRTGRQEPVQGRARPQHQEHAQDGDTPRPPIHAPTPRLVLEPHHRHPQAGRDPLPVAIILPGMHPQEPAGEVQPAALGPPPPRIVPRTVGRPPLPCSRVLSGTKQRRLPHGLTCRRIHLELPRRAIRRQSLAAVREMARRIERVAPVRMIPTAHHIHSKARSRLAMTTMMDVQPARPRALGKGTPHRQHRPKPALLIGLVSCHLKDTLAFRLRLCHFSWCRTWIPGALPSESRGHDVVKPAASS